MRLLPFIPDDQDLTQDSHEPENDTVFLQHRYNRLLLVLTLVLIGIGVTMVYSASIAISSWKGDPMFYLYRQLIFAVIGLIFMAICMTVHHELWRKSALLFLAFSAVIIVITPILGTEVNGAKRWIRFGAFNLQSSEIFKISWIIFLSYYLSAKQSLFPNITFHNPKSFLPLAIVLCIYGFFAVFLAIFQRDFGTTAITAAALFAMLFAVNTPFRYLLMLMGFGGLVGTGFIMMQSHRIDRIMTFLHPEADMQGDGYQINQALIAFGSGKWTGLGLGGSTQKLAYLPEAHTDFIFSIIGEELGLCGVIAIMLLFTIFVLTGFYIARKAINSFGALLAFGFTIVIGAQALVHMGVATAALPNKGLTLPFISYGGSSIIMLCIAVGIMLNISKCEPPPNYLHTSWRYKLFNFFKKSQPVPPHRQLTHKKEL